MKDLSVEVAFATVEEAAETLMNLLKACNTPHTNEKGVEEIQGGGVSSEVLALLSAELSNSNAIVRSNVQKALQLLSQLTHIEVSICFLPEIDAVQLSKLLEQYKTIILTPIFSKPLRSLKFMVQTGYIDALTFCFNLDPTFLSFTPDLLKLLQGTLAIAEKDDVSSAKNVTHKGIKDLTTLRTVKYPSLFDLTCKVSIELLSAAMTCPEFQGPEHQDFRNRIIAVFFKALTLFKGDCWSGKKGIMHLDYLKV